MLTPRRILLLVIDALLFAACLIVAYALRFGLEIPANDSLAAGTNYALQLKLILPWVVITHVGLYAAFHLYKGILKYAGSAELRAIAIAGAIHLAIWALFSTYLNYQSSFFSMPQRIAEGTDTQVLRIPYYILVLYTLMASVATGAVRFSKRFVLEGASRGAAAAEPSTLIVGAGDTADSLLRDIARGESGARAVCAVADSPSRVGLRLHGVPVVGTIEKIPNVIEEYTIEKVLIALDAPSPERLRQVVAACETAEVSFQIVPSLARISKGQVSITAAREIEIEDLLGRETVKLELSGERNYLSGRTVLVTGAGGSIGSELVRQIAKSGAAKIVLLGKGENSVFEIAEEMRIAGGPEVVAVIADVRNESRVARIMELHHPDVVFHAAAHKHVTLMEDAPDEAVVNNVAGTLAVLRASESAGVGTFILISSDKAVRPSSVMGATKRLAEMIVLSRAESSAMRCAAVRFGNVLGSRGSVIPLFRRQIAAGGPVTVTHPDAERYFMTIPEAVSLLIQAGSLEKGRLFMLDMGAPVRIRDLARNMITLSGFRPETDIKIEYTGLRPGEKLREELITQEEGVRETTIAKVFSAEAAPRRAFTQLEADVAELERHARSGRNGAIVSMLQRLIGDYHPGTIPADPAEEETYPETKSFEAPLPGDDDPIPSPRHDVILQTPTTEVDIEADVPEAEEPTPKDPSFFDEPEGEEPGVIEFDLFAETPEDGPEEEELDLLEAPEAALSEPTEEGLDLEPAGPLVAEMPSDEEEIGVEPSVEDFHAPAPLEEPEPEFPEIEIEEMEHYMTDQTVAGNFLVIIKVTPGSEADTLAMLFDQLNEKVIGNGDQVVCLVDEHTSAIVPEHIETIDIGGRSVGAGLAEAIASHPACGFAITMPSEVILRDGALASLSDAFIGNINLVYSNFTEVKNGVSSDVQPHDHERCPHERFEFGPVIAYRIGSIRAVGGIRGELNFAWEYDLHLKLTEIGEFKCVRENLYTYFVPQPKEAKGSSVYSPGMGPLGGFSYVFYPADMEREVTGAFEDAMKRRGTWLDSPTAEVNHGDREYDVLASVVIPILNRAKYIGNAIEKVQSGTFQDFEIIIIDNGSTDGTIEIIEKIAAEDARVRLLHGTGGTIASALNEGIRAARGKYICQLDSDDEYSPDTLEKMIGHLESHPKCGLAISYYRLMDEGGNIIHDIPPVTHSGYSRNQILRRDGGGAVRIFPKAVLEEFGFYDEEHYGNFGEDYDMVLKTGEKYDVDRVHEVLYHYRRHADNTDVTRDPVMKYKNKNRARQEALRRRKELNQVTA